WDMHLAAFASLLTLLGAQIAWLGISARTVAVLFHFTDNDPFLAWFYRHFKLESGLVVATVLGLVGCAILIVVVAKWALQGFPPLDEMRPIALAVTFVILGVQAAFNAFFLSLRSV